MCEEEVEEEQASMDRQNFGDVAVVFVLSGKDTRPDSMVDSLDKQQTR